MPENDSNIPIGDDEPDQEQPMDVEEAPRRAASAQLTVETGVGSAAALREAMDPANQSLADALRLSYLILKIVILVLVALFFVSGFQRVDQDQSGVMLRFGKIVTVGDQEALEPGLRRNFLPSPAGEFVIFDVKNRRVSLDNAYWPRVPANMTLERAIDRADVRTPLTPGDVGYVITAGGDLAHLKVEAGYEIFDPVSFVENVSLPNRTRIVELALQRAVVHTAATMTLQQLVDQHEEAEGRILQTAQAMLDELNCGVTLTEVNLPEHTPPFAIVKAYGELQNAREEANKQVETSRQTADEYLIEAAGPSHDELTRMVDLYQDAVDLDDVAAATSLMTRINSFMERDISGGDVARIIRRAQAYEFDIDLTLGSEARRFARELPRYRQQPELVTKRLWFDAVSLVMGRDDVEIFRVPAGMEAIDVRISGQEAIQRIRQEGALRRQQEKAALEAAGLYKSYFLRTQDWEIGKERPLLDVKDGKIQPRGTRN